MKKNQYKWSKDRIGILVNMWRDGKPISQIMAVIEASRSAVVSKAASLSLGAHADSFEVLRGKQIGASMAGVISSSRLASDKREEDAPVIKLARVAFLERRLPGEPQELTERWR